MAKKEFKSKHIESLISDKNKLDQIVAESTRGALSALLEDKVADALRKTLSESADSYTEEEVKPEDELSFENKPEENNVADVATDGGDDNATATPEDGADEPAATDEPEITTDGDGSEPAADGNAEGEQDVWSKFDSFIDADGEYDLRGKDIETVMDLIKQMDPDSDAIRIIKKSDDTAVVVPPAQAGEETFEINIDGANTDTNEPDADPASSEGEQPADIPAPEAGAEDPENGTDNVDLGGEGNPENMTDDDIDFELVFGDDEEGGDAENNNEDDMVNEGNVNLGYTDNYQKKTAMTMPHDKGDGEGDSRFDGGAPTGDGKRWVGKDGKDGGNPYTEKVNEETNECGGNCQEQVFEVELNDGMNEGASTVTRNNAYTRGTGRNQMSSEAQADDVRNGHHNGDSFRGTGDGYGMNESKQLEAMRRKVNAVLSENQELRQIAEQIKNKLHEAAVINSSLAKVVKLVTENTTSRDEKINILNRFDKVTTLDESRRLYEQISGELNHTARRGGQSLINGQINEGRAQKNNNMIVETAMLNTSSELQKILDLNERLSKM